jgi:hypothetical protein
MAIIHYEVVGGWHAEDGDLFIACFGITAEEAQASLERSQERARELERRLARAAETDVDPTEEDIAALEQARADVAAGRVVGVKHHC